MRRVAVLVAVLAAVVLGGALVADEIARRALERVLGDALQARVAVGGVSGLASGRLHVSGLRARKHGAWRIAVGDATIEWSPRALFERRVEIARVVVRQPRIAVTERLPDALPAFETGGEAAPLAVTLGRIVVDDGRVVARLGAGGERALYGADRVTADVRPVLRGARWAAVVRRLALHPRGSPLPALAAGGVVKAHPHGVAVALDVALADVGPARLDADVRLDEGPLGYRIAVATPGLSVRALARHAPVDRMRGSVVLHGEHDADGERLGYSAKVETEVPPLGPVSVAFDGHGRGAMHRLDATVAAAGARVTARGTLALDAGAVDAEVKASGDLAPLGRPFGLALGGKATASGTVRGALARPTVTATVDVDAPSYAGSRLQRLAVAAAVNTDGETVRVNVTRLVAIPLRGASWALGGPTTVTAGRAFGLAPATLSSADGRVTIAGTLGPDAAVDARLVIERLDLAGACRTLDAGECTGTLAARARVAGNGPAPRLEATVHHSIGAEVAAEGTVPFPWPSGGPPLDRVPFGLALRSHGVDAAVLQPFVKDALVHVGGRIDAALDVTGPLASPTVGGTLRLAGGRIEPVATRVRYEDVTVACRLEPGTVVVETLSARAGGTLTGGGRIGLRGFTPDALDLALDLERLRLATSPTYEVAGSGRVEIGGSPSAPVLRGAVEIGPAVFRPAMLPSNDAPLAPDPTIEIVGRAAPPPAAPPSGPGVADALVADLAVHIGDEVSIRRTDARIDLGGRLAVTKAAFAPWQVRGAVRLVRGWALFEGRRFTVEPGAVRFDGPPESPSLDLAATTRSGEYDVRVEVSGTPDKPVLVLGSEPPLAESDVLAVLLFGTPASELGQGQQLDLQRHAVGLASGYVASGLTQSVKASLGVDVLDVTMGGADQAGAVRVGRYLTQDVFLSIAQEFGTRVGQLATVEYRVRPRVSLRLSTSTSGSSGIDVFWHRRY